LLDGLDFDFLHGLHTHEGFSEGEGAEGSGELLNAFDEDFLIDFGDSIGGGPGKDLRTFSFSDQMAGDMLTGYSGGPGVKKSKDGKPVAEGEVDLSAYSAIAMSLQGGQNKVSVRNVTL
jgi:hypothetical protein